MSQKIEKREDAPLTETYVHVDTKTTDVAGTVKHAVALDRKLEKSIRKAVRAAEQKGRKAQVAAAKAETENAAKVVAPDPTIGRIDVLINGTANGKSAQENFSVETKPEKGK